jgi:nucleoid DNA-binding protein
MESLTTYIEELIYLHDQVVVPGLGTFIGRHESAAIEREMIIPPARGVLFNKRLQQDDGMLAAWIARREGIDAREARARVSRFRESLLERLERGERVDLGAIGAFSLERGRLAFEPPARDLVTGAAGMFSLSFPFSLALPVSLPASLPGRRVDDTGDYLHAGTSIIARLFRYGLSAAVITGIIIISQSDLFRPGHRADSAAMQPVASSAAPLAREQAPAPLPVIVSPSHDFVDYTPSL